MKIGCVFVQETKEGAHYTGCVVDADNGDVEPDSELDPATLAATDRSYILYRGREFEVSFAQGQPLRVTDAPALLGRMRHSA